MIPARSGGGRLARLLLGLLACLAATPHAARARTIDDIRAKGRLSCGVVVEQDDFTKSDSHGDLSLFASGICRAVAASVLGDARKLDLQGFPDDAHGVAALRGGAVSLLVGTTPEATRGLIGHLRFAPTLFLDGQGFLVRGSLHAHAPADLRDRLICYLSETPADAGLTEWSARAHVAIRPHPFEETGEMEAALTTGNCDAVTADVSLLAGMRAGFHARKADFDILPQMVTIDPFAPATRDDDPDWSAAVSAIVTALIEAEQDGVSSRNLQAMAGGPDPLAQRLLGPKPGLVSLLGLQGGWASRAIAASGNYGELLANTTGPGSPLGLPAGVNALWNAGGLIYAPSMP